MDKAAPGHFVLYTLGMIVAGALARIGWEVGGLRAATDDQVQALLVTLRAAKPAHARET